jgi:hypothetical protein
MAFVIPRYLPRPKKSQFNTLPPSRYIVYKKVEVVDLRANFLNCPKLNPDLPRLGQSTTPFRSVFGSKNHLGPKVIPHIGLQKWLVPAQNRLFRAWAWIWLQHTPTPGISASEPVYWLGKPFCWLGTSQNFGLACIYRTSSSPMDGKHTRMILYICLAVPTLKTVAASCA